MSWSQKAIIRNRRKRLARRLWKKQPLFAFYELMDRYPGYSVDEFMSDLKPRRPKKRKAGKSTLPRYGRYPEMMALLREYRETGDVAPAIRAQQLRVLITKPFRLPPI